MLWPRQRKWIKKENWLLYSMWQLYTCKYLIHVLIMNWAITNTQIGVTQGGPDSWMSYGIREAVDHQNALQAFSPENAGPGPASFWWHPSPPPQHIALCSSVAAGIPSITSTTCASSPCWGNSGWIIKMFVQVLHSNQGQRERERDRIVT